MPFRLTSYGFLDIDLADDVSNICDILPHAQEIARIGNTVDCEGQPWRFLTRSLNISDPHLFVGYNLGPLFREGSYGKIHKAARMTIRHCAGGAYEPVEQPHEVIIKRTVPPGGLTVLPAEDISAHISEALLHVLAWHTMQSTAAPWSIPRPYEVFGDHSASAPGWRSMSLCMDFVQGKTMQSWLQSTWKSHSLQHNAVLLLESLAQISYILWHLQRHLRLNHRDMKINNVLVRRASEPIKMCLGGEIINTKYEITLIDFGFACVSCPPPRQPMTILQAGSWFQQSELCCKLGRDIAQLIFCIHCYYPLEDWLPTETAAQIRSWCTVGYGSGQLNILDGFTNEGRPRRGGSLGHPEFNTGIYEFLRRSDVDPAGCAPLLVFVACANMLNQLKSDSAGSNHSN